MFEFIDWMLQLPPALEQELWQTLAEEEARRQMRYITSVERIGLERGRAQGLERGLECGRAQGLERGELQTRREAIAETLETRLQVSLPPSLLETLEQIGDRTILKQLFTQALSVASLEEFQQIILRELDNS